MGRKQFRGYQVSSADGKARLSKGVRGTQGLSEEFAEAPPLGAPAPHTPSHPP